MNVKRFTARTSREAFVLVRQAFGNDAVVLSTKPCLEGVEVLAMAPGTVEHLERVAAGGGPGSAAAHGSTQPASRPSVARDSLLVRADRQGAERPLPGRRLAERLQQAILPAPAGVGDDVQALAMSTLSFQDYVRERMLKRRQAALDGQGAAPESVSTAASWPAAAPAKAASAPAVPAAARPAAPGLRRAPEMDPAEPATAMPALADAGAERREQLDMVHELRAMKGLIEERFGTLAFMEKLQRHPRQAQLAQKLLDCSFSPGLVRKLVDALPSHVTDEMRWAGGVLERNLPTGEHEMALEEQGGVYALIGSTGVGKTTTTAKLAAAFATQFGAAHLGLVTLDAYRVGAHEQLRTYGRILGVPVHTAHDRASLEDLLELLAAKKMVLIDTAGMAQRDSRTRELLDMLSHPSIQRLLVLDASSQGETLDDVIGAWRASRCKGAVLSKIDEAVKLAPALDAVIRHKLKVWGVANGQRVPEDWHRLSANALIQRALKGGGGSTYRLDEADVQLVFSSTASSLRAGAVTSALQS